VSRARKPGDKFFLLETLICEIYVPILGAACARASGASERARENPFAARRWKFRNFIQ